MDAGLKHCTAEEFEDILTGLKGSLPDATSYQHLTTLMLEMPHTRQLARMDPFSTEYHQAVLELYLSLRGRTDGGYLPERDEAPSAPMPADLWSQLSPWGFRDPGMVGTHLYAWGHIMQHLVMPPGGSVLEYGPGSGQLLLMMARMGFKAFGVDVDGMALEGIRLQARKMGLQVSTERALFGEGFGEQRFDRIVFYEAFHHSIEFQALLRRLRDRLKPGGRVILCGEPVVSDIFPGIPYPWGPRLDALSVFCMRRFGWMELGFTHSFFMEAARRAGWKIDFHPFPDCGRAQLYVLQPGDIPASPPPEAATLPPPAEERQEVHWSTAMAQLRAELAAVQASTSWRVTRPLRLAGGYLARKRSGR